jgi:signal transduction histidine kinase
MINGSDEGKMCFGARGVRKMCRQQLQHEFKAGLEARIQERARIARELHDTLLQSFQGLLLRFQAVANLLPASPQDAKHKLESAIDLTAQAITEGRDAVQGLRRTRMINDLATALQVLGREFVADCASCDHIHFRIDVEGEPRSLHPVLRDEVYRIAAEALRNAFRHAQAQHIEVEVRYSNRLLRLRVRDDGKGLDAKMLAKGGREGHYGLHGMRERAQTIGGKLDVWSEVDAGTEVELSIPAAGAYAAPPPAGRFWPS